MRCQRGLVASLALLVCAAALWARASSNKTYANEQKKKTAPPEAARQGVEGVRKSVAVIEGLYGHGSGFIVLPNVIATNAHVVRDDLMKDVKVTFVSTSGAETRIAKVELLWEDKEIDLALLRVELSGDERPLQLAAKFEPGPNKKVFVVGNPGQQAGLARVNTISEAIAEDIVRLNKKYFLQLKVSNTSDQTNVGPGNSGGPVVDAQGRVVGVLTAGMTEKGKPIRKTFCVPAHAVQSAIDQLGSPAEWDDKVQKAMARHALDIVVVQLYLNAKIARNVFDARVDLEKSARQAMTELRFPAEKQALSRLVVEIDQKIIQVFKEVDTQCQRIVQGPYLNLTSNRNLPGEVVKDLNGMKTNLDLIRKTVMKKTFTANEYQQCCKNVSYYDTYFQRIKTKTGLSDEIVDEMLKMAILAADEKLSRHKLK